MPAKKVCLISRSEAQAFEYSGSKPDCKRHLHISKRDAHQLANREYGPVRMTERGNFRRRTMAQWIGNCLVIEEMSTPTIYRGGVQWRTDTATTAKIRGPRKNPRPPKLSACRTWSNVDGEMVEQCPEK